jgi:hypothetical protein
VEDEAALSSGTRRFIVLCALLQGLLLYLVQTGAEHAWWPFSELSGRVCWYALVLTVPSMICLSIVRLNDGRFWIQVLGVSAIVSLLAVWAAWSATGAPELRSASVLNPFGWCLGLAAFVALPYLQCRVQRRRWCAPYTELFERSWQNGLVIALTAVFVGLCWGLLTLCSELFKLIGVRFFHDLFHEPAFAYLASGVMVGLGILIGRVQQSPVRVARQIVLSVFKGLLPVLAIVALMFLIAMPFTGLESLWDTRNATATLYWLLLLLIVMVNAVFQDGRDGFPYPKGLRRAVEAALVAMPIFCALALYALWLRVAQYGWTQERICAAMIGLLMAGFSVGYAMAVFRSREQWLSILPRINVAVSLIALVMVVLVNSPLLDPHRITANSQISRLQSGANLAQFDVRHLRFKSGRQGYEALISLRDATSETENKALHEKIVHMLAQRLQPWERVNPDEAEPPPTRELARQWIKPIEGEPALEDDYLDAMLNNQLHTGFCLGSGSNCIVLRTDLDADGEAEHLLCKLEAESVSACRMAYRDQGHWHAGGVLNTYSGGAELLEKMRAGAFTVAPRRWGDLLVNGKRYALEHIPD